jgi:hypothetical protein
VGMWMALRKNLILRSAPQERVSKDARRSSSEIGR